MKVFIAFIWLLVALVASPQCASATEYRTVLEYWPQTLLPSQHEDSAAGQVLTQTVGTLVRYEENIISPYLAESWTISKDQTSYVFQLRKGGRFSNGSPITANEVILSLKESLVARKTDAMNLAIIKGAQAYSSGKARNVVGLKASGKYSLSIILEKPFPPLLDILTSPRFGVMLHSDIVRLKKEKVALFASSGPFMITSLTPNKHIELAPSPTYFGRSKVSLNKLVYDIVSDPKIAQAGLASGKYQDIIPFSTGVLPGKNLGFKKIPSLVAESSFLIFSLKHPQLNKKTFRTIISKNIDIYGFFKKMEIPESQRAFGMIPRGMLGYSSTPIAENNALITAKEIGDSINHPCSLSLIMYGEDNSHMMDALNALIAPLNKFPQIKLSLKMVPMNEYYSKVITGDYEIALFRMKPDSRDTYMMLNYIQNEKLFAPGYDRSEIKKLLQKARANKNFRERAEYYMHIDNILIRDQIIVPLFHGDRGYHETAKNVEGLCIPFLGYIFREYRSVSIGK